MMVPALFSFRFTPGYLLAGLPFGITPWTARVQVDAEVLAIRFGWWRLRTPVTNIVGTAVTGPFGFLRTAGSARLSLADVGLTCATNGERGLCIRFAQPVRGIEPFGVLRHPAVTVTVADPERLAAFLDELR
ncbi:MAG: hypothetical protein H0W37_12340 [Pseudonocardiales bacterium]|nr:hypothetical protein [Pseudonocardiales bacterium]